MRQWQPDEWFTASNLTNCFEAMFTADKVLVRNSKDKDGPVVEFTHTEWSIHTDSVKRGEVDLPA